MSNSTPKSETASQIVPFDFHGHKVRVIVFPDHDEWIAKDVCDALEIADPTSSLRGIPSEDKGKFNRPG